MPLPPAAVMSSPETSLLKWDGVPKRLDIGQLCYLRRNTSHKSRTRHVFDVTSVNAERVKAVQSLITQLSDAQRIGGTRAHTVQRQARTVVQFVNWADANRLHRVLCDKQETERAFLEYCKVQRELVSQNKLGRNTAASYQQVLRQSLSAFFDSETFGNTAPTLRSRSSSTQPTDVPDEEALGALLSWSGAFFSDISKAILELSPYPYAVTHSSGNSVWIVPTSFRRCNMV